MKTRQLQISKVIQNLVASVPRCHCVCVQSIITINTPSCCFNLLAPIVAVNQQLALGTKRNATTPPSSVKAVETRSPLYTAPTTWNQLFLLQFQSELEASDNRHARTRTRARLGPAQSETRPGPAKHLKI